jgi:hypothetical protein
MAEAHKRALRNPKYKTRYRVADWPEYEASLRRRGDISFWLAEAVIKAWTPPKTSKRGGQRRYSDLAIETALTLRRRWCIIRGVLRSGPQAPGISAPGLRRSPACPGTTCG